MYPPLAKVSIRTACIPDSKDRQPHKMVKHNQTIV